ncbi:MAG TPA: cell division protein FtsQ/DivIB [bacterium]|nr:cell division protein FtsQ/DivIB [bacterium]
MALYEGLNRGAANQAPPRENRRMERPAAAPAFKSLRVEVRARVREQAAPGAPFMDRFLGAGSAGALRRAGGALWGSGEEDRPAKAKSPAPRVRENARISEPRMQVVGAGESHLPQGRRGLGRAFLVVLSLAGATAALRPWQKAGLLKTDLSAMFQVPGSQDASAAAKTAALDSQAAADAAKLAALPLQAGTGKALALWQDGEGRWWRVDDAGALAPCADPSSAENLGLPEISGVAAHNDAYRGGRRLLLNLPPGRLSQLLPLRTAMASEVRTLDLSDPAQPVLLTLDGVRCLMGDADWVQRQEHLALVLADLAARRRRAGQIDLRFEGTAVVRPLGR